MCESRFWLKKTRDKLTKGMLFFEFGYDSHTLDKLDKEGFILLNNCISVCGEGCMILCEVEKI